MEFKKIVKGGKPVEEPGLDVIECAAWTLFAAGALANATRMLASEAAIAADQMLEEFRKRFIE